MLKTRWIGMRTFKTALAVALSMYLGHFFQLTTPLLAGISAIISIQMNIYETLQVSVFRMISTVFGAAVALVFYHYNFTNFFAIFIGTILIIVACHRINWNRAIVLACIVFLIVLLYQEEPGKLTVVEYALHRLLDTFVGLTVGFTVNYFISPLNPFHIILKAYEKALKDSRMQLKNILLGDKDVNDFTKVIQDANDISVTYKDIIKEKKLRKRFLVAPKDVDIPAINLKFYRVASLLGQAATMECRPLLNMSNREQVEALYGSELLDAAKEYADTCQLPMTNDDFIIFNYQISTAIETIFELEEEINAFKAVAKEKKGGVAL